MAKKNIYMVQVDHLYGNKEKSIYLPYAAGLLAAFAWSDETVQSEYSLLGFKFWREDIQRAVESLDTPYLVGFSCYIWNTEYNKAFAERLKETNPNCLVVFGGHNIPHNTDLLDQCPYIDILIHGEGEEAFKSLLINLAVGKDLSDIDNISFRDHSNTPHKTKTSPVADIDLPSPYLEGLFEPLFEKGHFNFCAVIETNRGCPNHCTYCDWGRLGAKFKMFPTDKVLKEIDWMAEHKIEYFWCADSSFGLFERDRLFIDRLIENKIATGYPKAFKANYAEHREIEVYDICRKLNEVNMNKGATLSFQSLDPTVLKNINRKNITMERFAEMMALYNEAGIATYAELILGLPGETHESFCRGIETLLEAGQHNALNLHALVLLPNSRMAEPAYIEKFGIKTVRAEFYQFHCEKVENDITEYYDLVIATDAMDFSMWVRSTLFFIYIQTFHQLGLLQYFAIYLYHEHQIKYEDFYNSLLRWSETHEDTLCGKVYAAFHKKLSGFADGTGSRSYTNELYGNIVWPLEEGAFLDILPNVDDFYEEIKDYLGKYGIDEDVFANLLRYQTGMMKYPGKPYADIVLDYDLHNYFEQIYVHAYKPPEKKRNIVHAKETNPVEDWKEYAITSVWYGRNDRRSIFSDVSVEYPNDRGAG